MAKQTKAKLDTKGLTSLGLEKLVEILLEESVSNKPLKARLLAALAGSAGPEEIARLIDKRLDVLAKSRSGVPASKGRELAVELLGIARNITSELAAADGLAAMDRMLRLLSVYDSIGNRLYERSVKLEKSLSDAMSMATDLAARLSEAQQIAAVPLIEVARKKDQDDLLQEMFAGVLCALQPAAADKWKAMIEVDAAAPKASGGKSLPAIALLQKLARQRNDLDSLVRLEEMKPENRRDNLGIARQLHEAGRHEEALQWLRSTPKGPRVLEVGGGLLAGVGSEYQARERKLLEADISDALKDRGKAQEIRWKEFLASYDAEILRLYIAKLPDFEEFDELDKAFAVVLAGSDIQAALHFLITWPKLDLASEHVIKHATKWDSIRSRWTVDAADKLAEDYPIAATILYRSLMEGILTYGRSDEYLDAATYWAVLDYIAPRLSDDSPIEKHDAYRARIKQKYARKFMFWNMMPPEFR
jgi:hypothetical protein